MFLVRDVELPYIPCGTFGLLYRTDTEKIGEIKRQPNGSRFMY